MRAVERVGPYRILKELGRGGMGAVYEAATPNGQRVALKVLLQGGSALPAQRTRFEREARALAKVSHPNVVRLLDIGEHRGLPYMVLELHSGGTLADELRAGPLTPAAALELGLQLAAGVSAAHAQGVLHRDLKPDNVLMEDGRALITDFGLAKDCRREGETQRLTRSGVFLGSPGYWAPEQARGDPGAVGPATDVYGLGATLYAALACRPPIEGEGIFEIVTTASGAPCSAVVRAATAVVIGSPAMEEGAPTRSPGFRLLAGTSLLGLAAMSVCATLGLAFVEDRQALFSENALPMPTRIALTVAILVAGALPVVAGLFAALRRGTVASSQIAWRWGHRVAPLILVGLLAPLLDRATFVKRPITVLCWTLVVGLLAAVLGTRFFEEGLEGRPIAKPTARPSAAASKVAAVLVGGIVLLLFAHFAVYSLMHHYQFRTEDYDLAIFDNMMWNLTHGNGFESSPAFGKSGNHLHRHTTFGALLLIPLYALRQQADTLLVIQAAFVASTPIPIYLLARKLLRSPSVGVAFAAAYALYAPVHGAAFYDFHFLTAASPLFAWVFYLLFTDRTRALVLVTAITLAWREDTGAVLAFAGAMVWLLGVHPRRTLIFIVVCFVYFVVVKFVFMPLGGRHLSFAFYYESLTPEGSMSFGGVIATLLTNPLYAFGEVLGRRKLLYVLQLFVPLLFWPLRHRVAWVAFVPAAVFTLLASSRPLFEIYFQYTAYWGPALFLAAVVALRSRFLGISVARPAALHSNVAAILLATTITSFYFGSVLQAPGTRGGFFDMVYEWTDEDRARLDDFRALAAQLPAGASVALTENEAPHVSARPSVYSLRIGYFDADYLLIRKTSVSRKSDAAKHFGEALKTGRYKIVESRGEFTLLRRDEPLP